MCAGDGFDDRVEGVVVGGVVSFGVEVTVGDMEGLVALGLVDEQGEELITLLTVWAYATGVGLLVEEFADEIFGVEEVIAWLVVAGVVVVGSMFELLGEAGVVDV
jgi:hypothetical protein